MRKPRGVMGSERDANVAPGNKTSAAATLLRTLAQVPADRRGRKTQTEQCVFGVRRRRKVGGRGGRTSFVLNSIEMKIL